jgi:hypothetical protein
MKVLTSQRLMDGAVVFYTEEGTWSERVDDAQVFEPTDPDTLLALARPDEDANRVVASYLIDVRREGSRVVPTRYRERIRAIGPTVRPDLQRGASLATS